MAKTGDILSVKEVSDEYRINMNTLAKWRSERRGPRFIKVGRKILYRRDDLEDYFNSHIQETIESI